MAAKKRTEAERQADLLVIGDLYVKNKPLRLIAEHLSSLRPYSLSHQQIALDVKELLGVWAKEHADKMEHYLVEQLRKIDLIELEYWEAWEKSKQPIRKRITKGTGARVPKGVPAQLGEDMSVERTVQEEERTGNQHYLEGVERQVDRRSKLLGLLIDRTENKTQVSIPQAPPFQLVIQRQRDAENGTAD